MQVHHLVGVDGSPDAVTQAQEDIIGTNAAVRGEPESSSPLSSVGSSSTHDGHGWACVNGTVDNINKE